MKIGLHYSLQTSPGENASKLIRAALDEIVLVEELGFSAVVFAEHHFRDDGWIPRPLMLAAAAAAVTKSVRVGTDVLILPLHHPVAVAEEVALLDLLSGGRAVLTVGLGWVESEYEGFGVPFRDRAAIYGRSIEIVRSLLAGDVVDNEGHYAFAGAKVRPLPVTPGGVPIWLGAIEDAGVRRAARTADAWVMPPNSQVSRLIEQRRLFDEVRAQSGRPVPTEQPLRREAFVAETDELAWKLFEPGIRYQYGEVYRPLHPDYPEDVDGATLRKWAEGRFLFGSVETVADELRSYEADLGATECLVRCLLPGISREASREAFFGFRDVISVLQGKEVADRGRA